MRQTLAILLDAYRELNARRLFWFTLVISGLVVVVFAMIGNNDRGLTILTWTIEIPVLATSVIPEEEFHKLLFVNLGIEFWLTWLANILALVSTASIFPDFLAGGAIELTLSKPISRLRLFLTKYAAALLFVALQVGIFTGASFLVIGLRGGGWIPALFLAIPIVVLVFSYLFSICVYLGTLWRSTIAALLLTLLVWGFIFLVSGAEIALLLVKIGFDERVEKQTQRIDALKAAIAQSEAGAPEATTPPAERPTEGGLAAGLKWALEQTKDQGRSVDAKAAQQQELLGRFEKRRGEMAGTRDKIRWWYGLVYGAKSVLPKTAETTGLLERYVIDLGKLDQLQAAAQPPENQNIRIDSDQPDDPHIDENEMGKRVQQTILGRSEWWVVGTSLAFEVIILALAARSFCTRDF